MSDAKDVCYDSNSKLWKVRKDALLGYDLHEAACCEEIHLRTLKISDRMESWASLRFAKSVPVVFCNNFEEILRCGCSSNSPMSPRMHETKPLQEHLHCLLKDLRSFFGVQWPSEPSIREMLKIGENYAWLPNCSSQHGSQLSPLQSIRKTKRFWQKKPDSRDDNQDEEHPLPTEPLLLTFGKTED